jgi:glycosyltransferase involved in cell wall biosynthesis
MRIAQVTATFPPYLGGAGTVAFHHADGLARRGHDVEVFTASWPGEPPASAATVHRLEPLWRTGNAPILPALGRLRGFDVVHLHHPFIFGSELVLGGRLRERAPLIVSYHNQLIGEGRRRVLFAGWEATVGRLLLRAARRVLVVSDDHAATVPGLVRIARSAPGKLAELPNGVDLDAFRPEAGGSEIRARHGIPAEAVVVAFVSALDRAHYLKRPDLAIAALAAASDPRLHLLVVGGGEWLERCRADAAAAGLGNRATFVGARHHEELPRLLRASNLLLVTSDRESFGIVLIEGMACGLPTISTDPPGIRSVVEAGTTGLLAPVGDAAALGAALDRLASDPGLRRALGTAGRARCEARYGWPQVVDRLEAVYRELRDPSPTLLPSS